MYVVDTAAEFPDCVPSSGLSVAFSHARRGLSVVPVRRDNKRSYVKWEPFQVTAATAEQITQWQHDYPGANVGVVTGAISGVFVIDIDSKDGADTIARWQAEHSNLPQTWQSKTGRGEHYWFKYPAITEIPNSAGKLAPGIDCRGEGGYVVAPGSIHESGARYEWKAGCSPDDVELADAPAWLIEKVKRQPKPVVKSTPVAVTADDHLSGRLRRIFEEERTAVASAPLHTRNHQLNRSTFALGQLSHYGAYTESEVWSAMEAVCLKNGLIGDDGQPAFRATFYSGWNDGSANSRDLREWQPSQAAREYRILSGAAERFDPETGEIIEEREGQPVDVVPASLGEWDAGLDDYDVPPRQWLLGTTFCRTFVSSIIAEGGAGKTALRITQALALATKRPLTGEYVFQRSCVLVLCLEDDRDEIRRRMKAAMIHHNIKPADIAGYFYITTPAEMVRASGEANGLVLAEMQDGRIEPGRLDAALRAAIKARGIDVVLIDPLVKAHRVEENSNGAMDFVTAQLAHIAMDMNVGVDAAHHISKGVADPGNANRARGASAIKDAARLVYTLTKMSPEEAQLFGIKEDERRQLVRVDGAKVNLCPVTDAKWYRLVGVRLGNGNDVYPAGDEVQAIEPWSPPDAWAEVTNDVLNRILTDIDAGLPDGNPYTDAPKATDRAAWQVVIKHAPEKTEADARRIIKTWVKNRVLVHFEHWNKSTSKEVKGLRVDHTKRPS